MKSYIFNCPEIDTEITDTDRKIRNQTTTPVCFVTKWEDFLKVEQRSNIRANMHAILRSSLTWNTKLLPNSGKTGTAAKQARPKTVEYRDADLREHGKNLHKKCSKKISEKSYFSSVTIGSFVKVWFFTQFFCCIFCEDIFVLHSSQRLYNATHTKLSSLTTPHTHTSKFIR